MDDIQIITQAETLSALTKAEFDLQISTAKAFPRPKTSIIMETVLENATMDEETASDCFYALKRGFGNDTQLIEGLSVRFAEVLANAWGNMRIQTRIIGNDGKIITAQGMCHDLQSNLAVSVEVRRRITKKDGSTMSEDMQVVTGMAASAVAYRNAVLKVIPKAITKTAVEQIKEVAMGKSLDLETARTNAVQYFEKLGVKREDLFKHLEVKGIEHIDRDNLFYLKGLRNALKEGTTNVNDTFYPEKAKPNAPTGKTEEMLKQAQNDNTANNPASGGNNPAAGNTGTPVAETAEAKQAEQPKVVPEQSPKDESAAKSSAQPPAAGTTRKPIERKAPGEQQGLKL